MTFRVARLVRIPAIAGDRDASWESPGGRHGTPLQCGSQRELWVEATEHTCTGKIRESGCPCPEILGNIWENLKFTTQADPQHRDSLEQYPSPAPKI